MLIKPKQEIVLNLKLSEIMIPLGIQITNLWRNLASQAFLNGLTQFKVSCKTGLEF
jgi:hypothetical protein